MSRPMRWNSPAVIGTGTMGRGIIDLFIRAGLPVKVFDLSKENVISAKEWLEERWWKQVERGQCSLFEVEEMTERFQVASSIADLADCDLIIEAVVEKLEIKQEVFQQLDVITPPTTLLATNTSSLSVTSIASHTHHPERVVGLHFFNPVWKLSLVEVVDTPFVEEELIQEILLYFRALNKEPIQVTDTPGFLVNRVARPFHLEAYQMVGEGLADKRQIDRIYRSAGFPMGPFELQDLIGIDINLAASISVYEGFHHDPRFRPHPAQNRLVESGQLGRKVGRGHYLYD